MVKTILSRVYKRRRELCLGPFSPDSGRAVAIATLGSPHSPALLLIALSPCRLPQQGLWGSAAAFAPSLLLAGVLVLSRTPYCDSPRSGVIWLPASFMLGCLAWMGKGFTVNTLTSFQ